MCGVVVVHKKKDPKKIPRSKFEEEGQEFIWSVREVLEAGFCEGQEEGQVCNGFEMSFQNGCDRVLKGRFGRVSEGRS